MSYKIHMKDPDNWIWFAGRDEGGCKVYEVHYQNTDLDSFGTYDKAYACLVAHIERLEAKLREVKKLA